MGAESEWARGFPGDAEEEREKVRLRRATNPRAERRRVRQRLFFGDVVGCMFAEAEKGGVQNAEKVRGLD